MRSALVATIAAVLIVYGLIVLALFLTGRRADARAWVGFVPDCVGLFKRLIGDPRVPRARKALLVLMVGYLVMPIDLVPDFIPVVGQLDDAIIVGLVLSSLVRAGGEPVIRENWRGPESSLNVVLWLAGAGGPSPPQSGGGRRS